MKFLRPIELRQYDCASPAHEPVSVSPFVNIYAKVTAGCNARCPFCCNASMPPEGPEWYVDKLFEIIREFEGRGIRVTRLMVTGGEPALVPDRVEKIVSRLEETEFYHIHTQLNTNGLLPASQDIMRYQRWDYISVSMHHYDLSRLSELYGTVIPADALDFCGIDRRKMNVSCNLIDGYIDSPEEAHKMIENTARLGIPRLGFIALLPMNQWCRDNFVPLSDIGLEQMHDLTPTFHKWDQLAAAPEPLCECRNFLYGTTKQMLDIYIRYKPNPDYCPSLLSYDGQHLHQGFGNDNIII